FAIVAEFPTPAIITCRPPRTRLSHSGLPAAVPAPRDATRWPRSPGPGRRGPKRRTSRRIHGPAGCPYFFLGPASPPPKNHARPQKLRPTPIGAQIRTESGQGSDVTEIICLVTVTCDGNGAVGAARPARVSHRRLR